MKNQVLSIDQMQRLKELGVDTSKANIYWARRSHGSSFNDNSEGEWFLSLQKEYIVYSFTSYGVVPTFTLQDIISMLPDSIDNNMLTIRKNANVVSVSYENLYTRSILSISQEDSLIKSSYEMLVWCLSYGIIKTNNKIEQH